jgi:hypothetical protein
MPGLCGGAQVSPIEYGHVLLVPRVLDCIPQRLDADNLLLALHMAQEADNPYLRIGYNSLGAFATINHLHFQVCSPPASHQCPRKAANGRVYVVGLLGDRIHLAADLLQ